ncbi:MAG: hypothetical protein ACT4OZ_09845 [Gemmatimonadota bacterium]
MMAAQVLRGSAIVALMVLCALRPFSPGPYDQLAVPMAAMAVALSAVGLLAVPAGLYWLIVSFSRSAPKRRPIASAVTIIALAPAFLMTALAATITSGIALGALAVIAGAFAARGLWRALYPPGPAKTSARAAGLWLILLPPITLALQLAAAGPASDASLARAIRNAAPLIAAIEQHRERNGRYPLSILAVHADLHPGVAGVQRYLYEPHFEAYNLVFEHFTFELGIRAFVVYNPNDEQVMTSHALDVLQLDPASLALDRQRGHNAVRVPPFPHWRIFLFD